MAATESQLNETLLIAAGLSKTFRSARQGAVTALKEFNLRLESGESVALLGPNGSGKTTAIHLMLGLEPPDAGTVTLFDLSPTDRRARGRLGYLPEETALFPFLTADETLHLAGRLHGMDRRARKRRADELIGLLGLEQARRRRAATYSKGMARRLAFGRAVMHGPDLLILDEPTAGLDSGGARAVFDLVEEERFRGAAVLFSTHLLREAEARCRRLMVLVLGEVACAGSLDALLGPEEAQVSVSGLDETTRRELAEWVTEHGGAAVRETGRRRTLERLFRSLIEERT
jgi:ABC-2 type transport system ATP-binding protein